MSTKSTPSHANVLRHVVRSRMSDARTFSNIAQVSKRTRAAAMRSGLHNIRDLHKREKLVTAVGKFLLGNLCTTRECVSQWVTEWGVWLSLQQTLHAFFGGDAGSEKIRGRYITRTNRVGSARPISRAQYVALRDAVIDQAIFKSLQDFLMPLYLYDRDSAPSVVRVRDRARDRAKAIQTVFKKLYRNSGPSRKGRALLAAVLKIDPDYTLEDIHGFESADGFD